MSRDKLDEPIHNKCIQKLFYDSIFNFVIDLNEEEINIHAAFEILLSLYDNKQQRQKLAEEGYLAKIFDTYTHIVNSMIV